MNCDTNTSDYDNDIEALFSVGRRFMKGDGVEKDVKRAMELLSQAAEMGHTMAGVLVESLKKEMQDGEQPSCSGKEEVVEEAIDCEYKKMLSGEIYQATNPYLLDKLNACKDLCWEYNNMRPTLLKERKEKLQHILGESDSDTFINQPFYCDYGKHIKVGKRFFANFNWTVLDEAYVTIGDDCFIGPNVSIYTACHSTDPDERNTRKEWAKPVTIGNNCWLGGNVTILPGVSIGDNVTIGAGSVVVSDIPSNSIAVGNPAIVKKRL